MAWFVAIVYAACLLYIFLFSLAQLHLTWRYRKTNRSRRAMPVVGAFAEVPVTIQLPVFNEKYVVERLLDAVARLDYPRHKLEIQILDDSTDETTQIILRKLEALRPLGLDIKLIHRENRKGFKAGALDEGFKTAQGEFIAIFDADFVPEADFLRRTLPHFHNLAVGVVQTRWAHINRDYSLLTQLQAFGLDAHFTIEQKAREAGGSFMNFNGTCGVWRKACIADAGGWKFDTLTEDLDLSYRAQLKGWQFTYLEDVSTPGELPVAMAAIKSQQYRWNKGGAETAKKMFGSVLRARMPVHKKIHAFFHLFNSSVFVAIFIAAILSIPLLYLQHRQPGMQVLFNLGAIFLAGFFSIAFFYWTATQQFHPRPLRKFVSLFPFFIIVSMGLSLHNALAVAEAWLGIKTPFVRTPKFNVVSRADGIRNNAYLTRAVPWLTVLEGLLCLYFIAGMAMGLWMEDRVMIFFHLMLATGFGMVCCYSLKPGTHA